MEGDALLGIVRRVFLLRLSGAGRRRVVVGREHDVRPAPDHAVVSACRLRQAGGRAGERESGEAGARPREVVAGARSLAARHGVARFVADAARERERDSRVKRQVLEL